MLRLAGWKRAVADELARLYAPGRDFSLVDFYRRASGRLQEKYPNNTTVHDSIRAVLQDLRDLGMLRFHGNGQYTYLGEVASPTTGRPSGSPLALAAYELAARVTSETGLAASEYLEIARSSHPEAALRQLLGGAANSTFRELHRRARLDLSFERLVVDHSRELGLERDLVRSAIERLDYYDGT